MDEKYKSLKSKHELLKEGFKKLYSDYETVKNDLSAKLEEFSKLHEENSQLKHNYDLLLNEINQPTRLKGVQSWTNALTLIKGGTDTDTQKYIDEINTLKAKLESTLKLTEAMDLEKRELERDMEDMKAKHGVVVSELKDRLLGLESILKDLQEQLNKNELKLTQYTSDIKSLNTELQHKNHQIFQLQLLMENSRTAYESEKLQWDRKLNEKFKFDLRRNPHINLNNSYQNTTSHEMCVDGMSCGELSGRIIASLSEVFKSWSNCLRFIPSGVSSDAFSTESDCTFVTLFTQDLHLLRNLDSTTREIEGIIVKICHGLEFVQATGYFKLFLQLMKQLIKHQRIYFCLENFLTHFNPQDGGNSGTIGNSCTSVTSGEVNLM